MSDESPQIEAGIAELKGQYKALTDQIGLLKAERERVKSALQAKEKDLRQYKKWVAK